MIVEELNLSLKKNQKKLESFLESQNLKYEKIDTCVVIYHNSEIIASASKDRNVFKMIAVNCEFQAQDLVAKLLTALIEICHQQGIFHYFIFTKLIYQQQFNSLGFKLVVSYEEIGLFEMGQLSLFKQIDLYNEKILKNKVNGAIVMNANPFTNGHLYLVQEASKQVEQLIIFVVEEDLSDFSFEQRFKLVVEGVKHLNNVVVVASGPYIISAATFPSYFLKSQDEKNRYYLNIDIAIFEIIMTKLNIESRFVGSEPTDLLTASYNDALKKRLGNKLIVIDRIEVRGQTISASLVRSFYEKNDLISLKPYVPKSTYDYLKKKTNHDD